MSYRPLYIIKIKTNTSRDISVVASPGTTLMDAANRAGLDIGSVCSGQRDCGQCLIIILEGQVSALDPDERDFLSPEQLAGGYRLACCARVNSPVTARLAGKNEGAPAFTNDSIGG